MPYPDYVFTNRWADINGHRMHYLDEGPPQRPDAPTLVMLHGNPSWSFFWRKLVKGLRTEHRCIVPDHIGMGLSDKPSAKAYPHHLSRRVDDLERLLDERGVRDDLTLVVHDWGGMIGMDFATRHPERIRRLVILNTAAFRPPAGKTMPWQIAVARTPGLGPWLVKGLNLFVRGAAEQGVARQPLSEEIREAYMGPYDTWSNREAVHRFVLDIPVRETDPSYARLVEVEQELEQFADRPTLICWGMKDFVFDRDFLQTWLKVLPEAEVERYEDAGHYVMEDAGDRITPRVKAFLARHPIRDATATPPRRQSGEGLPGYGARDLTTGSAG